MTATTICNFSFERFSIKKAFLKIAMLLFWSVAVFADSSESEQDAWTLAAEKFVVKQQAFSELTLDSEAQMIPEIILEQISQSFSREIPDEEILRRKQNKLLVDRLSLFLQLSKEVKSRDSLVVSEQKEKRLKKKIAVAEKKIEQIKTKIDENLEESERLDEESEEKASLEKKDDEKKVERGSIYKKDSLFCASSEAKGQGYESFAFSKVAESEGIQGLICGTISPFGDYVSVRATLRVFPSGAVAGSVTEVGSLSDCVQIAKNLARSLMPLLSNSMPIHVFFDVEPQEAKKNISITLDDVVFPEFQNEFLLDAGIHTFCVSADGFDTETFSYNFKDKSNFSVKVNMNETKNGSIEVYLKKSMAGTVFANGVFAGDIDDFQRTASVKINGKNIIGQFCVRVPDEDGEEKTLSSYFFIPAKKVFDGDFVSFRASPVDTDVLIDKSRRRMYTSYTLMVLSLPAAFYSYGKFDSARQSYNLGYSDDAEYVRKWRNYTWGFFGLSALFCVNFTIQLSRYLHDASKVLPVTAKKAKSVENIKKISETADENESKDGDSE